MTHVFFSFCSCILPQIFLDCFPFALLFAQINGASEKELEGGLECNTFALSYEMSSAGSWGAYLGRVRDGKEYWRAAAQGWEKHHFFSAFITKQTFSRLTSVLCLKKYEICLLGISSRN